MQMLVQIMYVFMEEVIRNKHCPNLAILVSYMIHTATTESRAATAKISAQDTIGPQQTWSTADLILSITSNPLRELALGMAVFSPTNLVASSNRTDASQPYTTLEKTNYTPLIYTHTRGGIKLKVVLLELCS